MGIAAECRTRRRAILLWRILPGRLSARLQPNHPADDARAIAAAILDGLSFG
ncbi:ethanolamine ammonia-lyase subunit EutB, partial [Marivita sp.]|uniref:ethanolamine ammonia-lyase subunit EutB n=1 Tax=Marivita sp. TaxID=2003365 RepID=UPI00321B6865